MSDIPKRYIKFKNVYSDVANAYEIIGLPSMIAALSWVDDILES